jgi:tellurite resistance protein TerC
VHLHYGLAVVLSFIGVKLVLHYLHTINDGVPQISTGLSLAVVATVLATTTVTSLRSTRNARAVELSTSAAGSSRYSPSAQAE